MSTESLIFECGKLVAQLLAAVVVARLTVRWALDRYKAEKMWERRLASYADVISALGELRRVNTIRRDEDATAHGYTDEFHQSLSERYASAKARVEEAAGAASLILPERTAKTLADFEERYSALATELHYFEDDDHERLLRNALEEIVQQGRTDLGTKTVW